MEALSAKLAEGRVLVVDEMALNLAGSEQVLRKVLMSNMRDIKNVDGQRPVVKGKALALFRLRIFRAIKWDRTCLGVLNRQGSHFITFYRDNAIVDNIMTRLRENGYDSAEFLYRTSAPPFLLLREGPCSPQRQFFKAKSTRQMTVRTRLSNFKLHWHSVNVLVPFKR
jgi:hypothetical protein